MKKRMGFCIFLLILIMVLVTACGNVSSENPPDITVTAGDQSIHYQIGMNQWNGAVYDREESFTYIAKTVEGDFQYIPLNETITIKFSKDMPDQYALYDYVLDKDGSVKYKNGFGAELKEEIDIRFSDKKASFTLLSNPAAMLSSNSEDYLPGETIRGFKLRCKWSNGNDCEYAFIISSDAM